MLEEQTLETIRLSAKRETQAQRVAGKVVVSLSSFSTPTSFPADSTFIAIETRGWMVPFCSGPTLNFAPVNEARGRKEGLVQEQDRRVGTYHQGPR